MNTTLTKPVTQVSPLHVSAPETVPAASSSRLAALVAEAREAESFRRRDEEAKAVASARAAAVALPIPAGMD